MAADETAGDRVEDMPGNAANFEFVLSKKNKKKKKVSLNKEIYATRSKAGLPKPLK
jgi:hypothetical protein